MPTLLTALPDTEPLSALLATAVVTLKAFVNVAAEPLFSAAERAALACAAPDSRFVLESLLSVVRVLVLELVLELLLSEVRVLVLELLLSVVRV
ncbi:hypothetical protein D3C71_1892500 [compost metagenome]